MSKSIHDIMTEATDEQIVRWWPMIQNNVWPPDMPIPFEAFSDVWNPIQRRLLVIENQPKKKE